MPQAFSAPVPVKAATERASIARTSSAIYLAERDTRPLLARLHDQTIQGSHNKLPQRIKPAVACALSAVWPRSFAHGRRGLVIGRTFRPPDNAA
ncbi:hypothetical protein AN191_12515 [Loktanella sp. 5RATIMAR09]|nr:hypothetical protein AN191_12515 [Loktanella sp. 5RATIMAR09]